MAKRKTHEEFINEFYKNNKNANNIILHSKYVDALTKISCECKECGYTWNVKPQSLTKGSGCEKCSYKKRGKNRMKSHEQFVEEIKQINPNIKILGQYKTDKIHIKCKCVICEHEWDGIPNNLLKGSQCPSCSWNNRIFPNQKTHEQFIKEMNTIHPNIEVLGQYIRTQDKVTCKCKVCENIWDAKPCDLLHNHGCPSCSKKRTSEKLRKSHEDFLIDMATFHPELEVLSEYATSKDKVTCKCRDCGNLFEMTPNSLLCGQGCPPCNRKKGSAKLKLTNEEFVNRIKVLNPTYKIIDEYKDCETKVRCICNLCGGEWKAAPIKLLNSRGCPICVGKDCIAGINDIATKRPDLVKYFVNIEDSTKYTLGTRQRLNFKCPDCGTEKEMAINVLTNYGFSCDICSDNFSYPNKYMRGFISQLPVKNIKYEYSPEWIKPYRYDSYFEYNGQSYIMEMDGALGHGNFQYGSREKDLEGIERDKYKDKMANLNNIKVIRIDCINSDSNYISNNIIRSELSNIFDLSSIDWNECNKFSTKSIVKDVCDYFNKTNLPVSEIAENLKLGRNTVRRYLKRGNELGWCNFIPNGKRMNKVFRGKKIQVIDNDKILYEFNSSVECAEKLSNVYNTRFVPSSIRSTCNRQNNIYKGLIFQYAS